MKFVQVYFASLGAFSFSNTHTPEALLKDFKSQFDYYNKEYKRYLKMGNATTFSASERKKCAEYAEHILTKTYLHCPKLWTGKDNPTDKELLEFFDKSLKEYAAGVVAEFEKKALPVLFVITDSQQSDFRQFIKNCNAQDRIVYESPLANNSNYMESKPTPYMQVVILDYTKKESQ